LKQAMIKPTLMTLILHITGMKKSLPYNFFYNKQKQTVCL
jgi:hypothetical protein